MTFKYDETDRQYWEPLVVRFWYRNYKGETAERRVVPLRMHFGSTEHHPTPQWLLEAWDLDKNAARTFAVKDVWDWRQQSTNFSFGDH